MDRYEILEKAYREKLFIPGTNVLKNKIGIKDKDVLNSYERLHFSNRSLTVPDGDLSTTHLKELHKHLLQDVYEWAGKFRTFPTARGGSSFCVPRYIDQETDKITKSIDISKFKEFTLEAFAKELAEIVGELNAVHPFLDGNGRVIRVYAQKLSKATGYKLDILRLQGDSWNKASVKSFFGDNKELTGLLQPNLLAIKKNVFPLPDSVEINISGPLKVKEKIAKAKKMSRGSNGTPENDVGR